MHKNRETLKKIIAMYGNVENIGRVQIDSRLVAKNDIFIAIRGGNHFVNEALERGAALVFYDDQHIVVEDKRAIYVEDSVKFLQELAKKYREQLAVKIFAITGSNGKTSTKDILYQILSNKYKGKKTQGNYNNHIGLPFTILGLEDDDQFMVLEMGMSGLREIDILCEISKPDYGIITNIGESHLEYLKTKDNVFKAKTEILYHVKAENIFVSGDDQYLKKISGVIKVGEDGANSHRIESIVEKEGETRFTLDGLEFKTNLLGRYNVKNSALALLAAEKFGVSKERAKETLKNIELTKMRFQKIETGNILYINDAYNASPSSMKVSLETFDKLYNDRFKIAVLGDMLELGENSRYYHEGLADVLEKSKIDMILLYGERMLDLFKNLNHSQKFHFENKGEISEKIRELGKARKISVLLKGSRGMKLEEIIKN